MTNNPTNQKRLIDDIALEIFQPPEFTLYVRGNTTEDGRAKNATCGYVDRIKESKNPVIIWPDPTHCVFEFEETKTKLEGLLVCDVTNSALYLNMPRGREEIFYLFREYLRHAEGYTFPHQHLEKTADVGERFSLIVQRPVKEAFIELRNTTRLLQAAMAKYEEGFKKFKKEYAESIEAFLKKQAPK